YVSAPADKIFANESTLTGSIGVIMQSMNFSGLAEKYGIEFNTIKSGKHKDIMSPTREMTKEENKIMQSMIDEMYDEFVDVVVEIGSFEDTINELMEDYDLNDAQVIQYDLGPGYWTQFLMSAKNIFDGDSNEIKTIMNLISESDQPRAMYLY